MKRQLHWRQGDILIRAVKSVPDGAQKQKRGRALVLGEGEVKGHRHEILETSKVDAYKLSEGIYLEVAEEIALVHPEHAQIALLPGSYEVIRQTEFQRKELRRVQD